MSPRLLIDERLGDDEPRRTWLRIEPGSPTVALISDEGEAPLPARALAVAMRRYGRELDDAADAGGERYRVGDLGTIERLRFRARVDAEGRDYLVWREADRPPLAALSIEIAAALRFLARETR